MGSRRRRKRTQHGKGSRSYSISGVARLDGELTAMLVFVLADENHQIRLTGAEDSQFFQVEDCIWGPFAPDELAHALGEEIRRRNPAYLKSLPQGVYRLSWAVEADGVVSALDAVYTLDLGLTEIAGTYVTQLADLADRPAGGRLSLDN